MTETVGANWFSYIALLAWPLVALFLYSRRPFAEATAWTVLGALLFLPSRVAIKLEMIPAIDKNSIASFSVLTGCVLFAPRVKLPVEATKVVAILAGIYVVSPVITSLLNNDVITAGFRIVPGVGYYDGVSALLSQSIFFIPFFVGVRALVQAEDTESLLRVSVLAALIYSAPMLFEIRMAPVLSQWVYGVSSASSVEMRYGGFRPVVFMINGLAAAFFLSTAILAAVAFWRAKVRVVTTAASGITAYLGVVLVLCKSAGALVYAIIFGLLIRWSSPRIQMRLAVVLSAIAIAYPILRMSDLVPTTQLLSIAADVNSERSASLGVRFEQEGQLLSHASERFWFGWGRYGRSRLYDDYGKDISITDGQWIVTFGQFGIFGFIAQFGLLTLPVFAASRVLKVVRSQREAIFLSCFALTVALIAIEQVPNASISSWSWLLAGSLLGRCSMIRARAANGRRATGGGQLRSQVLIGNGEVVRRNVLHR